MTRSLLLTGTIPVAVLWAVFWALLWTLLATPSSAFPRAQEPLNVLWLSVEDMSPWIGPYGDQAVPTPHLDAFAKDAIRYDNAFADSPVCAPARTALITGVYPTRMGAMHMRVRSRSKATDQKTPLYEAVPAPYVRCFPETLRARGYYAVNRSKKDYQFRAPAWTWNESSGKADYSKRPAGAPFFAVVNHTGTHESRAFPGARKAPEKIQAADVPIPPIYPDTPHVRDALARTYNNIAAMDAWFGREIEKLEEAGLAQSTVVFFFSDHGVGLPRGKRSLYGTGTRVPLLIRFPEGRGPKDLPPGSSADRIVSFIDFGPTVLSLAGIEPDQRLDGRAFLGPHAAPPRSTAFFHADRFDGVYDRARAATDGTRLVIRNLLPEAPHLIGNAYRERLPMTQDLYDLRDGGPRAGQRTPAQWQTGSTRRPEHEWYDRTDDPWEVRSLVNAASLAPEERTRFESLDASLDEWMAATGDLGLVMPETRMIREHLWPPHGKQPTTAAPTLERTTGGLTLACATKGASLAYRWSPEDPWLPAHAGRIPERASPASQDGPRSVQACAHRLGFLPSAVVTLRP